MWWVWWRETSLFSVSLFLRLSFDDDPTENVWKYSIPAPFDSRTIYKWHSNDDGTEFTITKWFGNVNVSDEIFVFYHCQMISNENDVYDKNKNSCYI
jgi:hypothetical protein